MKFIKEYSMFSGLSDSMFDSDMIRNYIISAIETGEITNIELEWVNELYIDGDGRDVIMELDRLDYGIWFGVKFSVDNYRGESVITVESQTTGQLETSTGAYEDIVELSDLVEVFDDLVGEAVHISDMMRNTNMFSEDEEVVRSRPGFGGQDSVDAVAGDLY